MFINKKTIISILVITISFLLYVFIKLQGHFNKPIQQSSGEVIFLSEEFSKTNRKMLVLMNNCHQQQSVDYDFFNCIEVKNWYTSDVEKKILDIIEKLPKLCNDKTLEFDLIAYSMVIKNYRHSNTIFLKDKLTKAENNIRVKCKL